MTGPRLVAVLREALGDGGYGGWHRDRTYPRSALKVWKHHNRLTVVVESPPRGQHAVTLRILEQAGDDYTVLADCKVETVSCALLVLRAYCIIDARHTTAYRAGRFAVLGAVNREVWQC